MTCYLLLDLLARLSNHALFDLVFATYGSCVAAEDESTSRFVTALALLALKALIAWVAVLTFLASSILQFKLRAIRLLIIDKLSRFTLAGCFVRPVL